MATIIRVAARDASYYHDMLQAAVTTLCGLATGRMSEREAGEGMKRECVACATLAAALAPLPHPAPYQAAAQTPDPGHAGPGQPYRMVPVPPGGTDDWGRTAPVRGDAVSDTDPATRGPDQGPRVTDAETRVLAYVTQRPRKECRRPVIAAALGLGGSTVGSVLDRAIARRQEPGLWKPRRGVWQYDPPTAEEAAAASAPKPVLLDKAWRVLTEEPTKDGRFIAIGEQSGRPYTFDLL